MKVRLVYNGVSVLICYDYGWMVGSDAFLLNF